MKIINLFLGEHVLICRLLVTWFISTIETKPSSTIETIINNSVLIVVYIISI